MKIHLLGMLDLVFEDKALTLPASPTLRSLLAYLIHNHDRAIARDRLLGIFWPERSDAQARRALSNALWRIRQTLGPAAERLLTEHNSVTFTLYPQDDLDVATFESLAPGDPAQAITRYTADFMEACYDDWAILERERLNELRLSTLARLVALEKQNGQYTQAIDYALQLIAVDPLRETAHQDLMRLYHCMGRPQAALEQFAVLRDRLAAELDVPPTPDTVTLYEDIKTTLEQGDRAPITPPLLLRDLSHLPFVGRCAERAALLHALQAAAQGHGGWALLRGEAGVGKSRLVAEAIAEAEWHAFQIGAGAARPATTLTAYHSLQTVLIPLLTPLRIAQLAAMIDSLWLNIVAPIFPPLLEHLDCAPPPPLEPQEEQRRLREGIVRFVAGLAAIAPVLLVLEDVQWLDEATLAVLPLLVSNLSPHRLLLILTYRPAEARARAIVRKTLDALTPIVPALRLELRPFECAETVTLVQRALGVTETAKPVRAFAERIQRDMGGNPFLLIESLKSLLEQGHLARSATGAWQLPPDDLPLLAATSIQALIRSRLAQLPAASRAVLDTAAVLGEQAEFPLLLALGQAEPAALLSNLETLMARGFLVERETGYSFAHDHIQDSVYRLLTPERRRQLHHMAGTVLEAHTPDRIEVLAQHYEQGQVWDKALHYYRQAGKRAVRMHAYPIARHHYDRAIALVNAAQAPPDVDFDLLGDRERVLDVLSERDAQAADLEAMAQLITKGCTPQHLLALYCRKAYFLGRIAHYGDAQETISLALTLADLEKDESGKAAALVTLGTLNLWAGQPNEAIPHFHEAIDLYQREADPAGETAARNALGDALLSVTNFAAAERELQSALSLSRSLEDRPGEAKALMNLGILSMQRGDANTAISCYQLALETSREIGYRYNEICALGNLANLFYYQGNAAQAISAYNTIIPLCETIGERRVGAQARINRASIQLSLIGEAAPALADVEASLAYHHEAGDPVGEGHCLCVRGQIAIQEGRLQAARADLEQGLALLLDAGERWVAVQVYHFLARLSLAEGRPDAARRYVDEAQGTCQELELTDWAVNVLALRGLVLLALGQPEAALAATTEAVTTLTPDVTEPYLIFFWHYQVLKALRLFDRARGALQRAYDLLTQTLADFSPEERARSLAQVHEHRAIVAAWQALQPHQIVVRLPHADAPAAGRPLRDDEQVAVTWTIFTPEDDAITGKIARRQHQLLRLLREAREQSAAPTVQTLSVALDVAPRTIKRDLAALRAQGHDARTRGGP
ncbi:MAG TPA: tetratricopeptide repeat protein [Anaerolineae bacterium]|nr:tetratricopeptide repeat protein [Anaerolineae bacterium]